MNERMKGCKGCGFRGIISGHMFCDYIGYTGQRRGCPPGAECTKRMTPEEVKRLYVEPGRRLIANECADAKNKRTTVDARKAIARGHLRREDRGDMARQLGMSPKAAEAIYGGGKK